jgi:hypothetical protein
VLFNEIRKSINHLSDHPWIMGIAVLILKNAITSAMFTAGQNMVSRRTTYRVDYVLGKPFEIIKLLTRRFCRNRRVSTRWVANVESGGKNAPSNALLDMPDEQMDESR